MGLGLLAALWGPVAPLRAQAAPVSPPRVGTVAGVVLVDSLNTPVAGAEVRLSDAELARTDSTGRFEILRATAGVRQILVRAVGFEPYGQTISIASGGRVELELTLRPEVQPLRAVSVSAARPVPTPTARAGWQAGFEERRKGGLGHFVSGDQLSATDSKRWTTDVIARVPGLRLARYSGRVAFTSSRGVVSVLNQPRGDEIDRKMGAPKACYPIVIVDDIVRYGAGPTEPLFDTELIDGTQVAAVEYYAVSELPVRFNRGGNAACGAVVIWLR